jgi:SAM-dependent methyltransferase
MKYTLILKLLLLLLIELSHSNVTAQEEDICEENNANQYMNQSSIESLVNAFDSPDREKWQQPEKVIALFGNVTDKTILDLGAGSGYFTLRLAAKGAQVISADVSDNFQNVIQEKLTREDFKQLSPKIELRKVPYDGPGLDNEEVDGILIVNTWHHIDDRTNYMRKLLNGVKKGGKIIIVDFKLGIEHGPPDSHKLGLEDALEEIKDINFAEILVENDLLERQYILIGTK